MAVIKPRHFDEIVLELGDPAAVKVNSVIYKPKSGLSDAFGVSSKQPESLTHVREGIRWQDLKMLYRAYAHPEGTQSYPVHIRNDGTPINFFAMGENDPVPEWIEKLTFIGACWTSNTPSGHVRSVVINEEVVHIRKDIKDPKLEELLRTLSAMDTPRKLYPPHQEDRYIWHNMWDNRA